MSRVSGTGEENYAESAILQTILKRGAEDGYYEELSGSLMRIRLARLSSTRKQEMLEDGRGGSNREEPQARLVRIRSTNLVHEDTIAKDNGIQKDDDNGGFLWSKVKNGTAIIDK